MTNNTNINADINVFDLLPALDELNDVDSVDAAEKPATVKAKPATVKAKPAKKKGEEFKRYLAMTQSYISTEAFDAMVEAEIAIAKAAAVEAKPVDVEAKPVNVEAKPVNVEAKPAKKTKSEKSTAQELKEKRWLEGALLDENGLYRIHINDEYDNIKHPGWHETYYIVKQGGSLVRIGRNLAIRLFNEGKTMAFSKAQVKEVKASA